MNKTLKWILGILLALVIVAAITGIGYLVFARWNGAGWMMADRDARAFGDGRAQPGQVLPGRGIRPYGMMPWGGMHGGWGMHSGWFGGFFPLGMIFGGLLQLGILALIIYGVYALIRGLTRSQQVTATPLPASAPAPQAALPVHACTNCGYAVQEGWKHCPNCGQVQSS